MLGRLAGGTLRRGRAQDTSKRRMSREPAALEPLECRRLLSMYLINTNVDLQVLNSGVDLNPGDYVLFKAGTSFSGGLTLSEQDSGTAASPVTIRSYALDALGHVVLISDDASRATLNAGAGHGLRGQNASGINISYLNFAGTDATHTNNGIWFDNNKSGNVKLPHVWIDHVKVSGFGKYGITIGGSVGKSGFSDVRITYAEAVNNDLGGIETHGYFSSTATGYANTNVYVGYSKAYNNAGIPGWGNHSGDGIMLSDVDGGVIERSVAYNNGLANTHVGGPVGIWGWDVNNLLIQYNESHHNRTNSTADGGGFDLDGGVTNSVMQYNWSHDNDGAGYGIYQFSGARPFHHNVVRYNISQNDGRKNGYPGIDFWNGGSGVSDTEVYNNTVYMSPAASGTPRALRITTALTRVHIRNNILVTTGGLRLVELARNKGLNDLRFENNDYWSSGAAFQIRWGKKTYQSLTAWRNATGQERLAGAAVGFSVNPMLKNAGGGWTLNDATRLETMDAYRLTSASPLVNKGLNLWSRFGIDPGRRDFYAVSLPASSQQAATYAYDLGASELLA